MKIFFYIIIHIFLLIFSLFLHNSDAKEQIKVAVIDTGLDLSDERFKNILCKDSHRNLVNTKWGIKDTHGHGTHVAGLIKEYAKNSNYCIIIYKYTDTLISAYEAITNEMLAIQDAIDNGVTIINFSSGGTRFVEREYLLIKNNPNVIFVVAAGNDGKNLNDDYKYYPASYDLPNIIVVGSLLDETKKSITSNYGIINMQWEIGDFVKSTCLYNKDCYMSGTSMATAIHTGKLIYQRSNK